MCKKALGGQTEHSGQQHFWGKTKHAASPWVNLKLESATWSQSTFKNIQGIC